MKINFQEEIDFQTGNCSITFESKLLYAIGRATSISNPYVGNKRKLLYWITEQIHKRDIPFDTVLDLFSGGHSFSILMKLLEKNIISNDILESSAVFGRAFVENNSVVLSDDDIGFLLSSEKYNDRKVLRNLIDWQKYFTEKEAEFLDGYRWRIVDLPEGYKRDLALANIIIYVIDKCFVGGRLNNGQILARLDHRIAHPRNRGFSMGFRDIFWYKCNDATMEKTRKSFSMDCMDFLSLKIPVDLAYIDPPYGGDQSDYSYMYHILESYAKMEIQENAEDCKRFSVSNKYEDNFVALMEALSFVPVLVISYNDSSWASIDVIISLLCSVNRSVETCSEEYNYNYRSVKKQRGKEYLVIAS